MPWKNKTVEEKRAYHREYYKKDYARNKARYAANNKAAKKAKAAYIAQVKSVPCMDCEQSYPSFVMDFDHRPGEIKLEEPGRLIFSSWKKLLAELAKCDVVCANCHRIRTFTRRNLDTSSKPILAGNAAAKIISV